MAGGPGRAAQCSRRIWVLGAVAGVHRLHRRRLGRLRRGVQGGAGSHQGAGQHLRGQLQGRAWQWGLVSRPVVGLCILKQLAGAHLRKHRCAHPCLPGCLVGCAITRPWTEPGYQLCPRDAATPGSRHATSEPPPPHPRPHPPPPPTTTTPTHTHTHTPTHTHTHTPPCQSPLATCTAADSDCHCAHAPCRLASSRLPPAPPRKPALPPLHPRAAPPPTSVWSRQRGRPLWTAWTWT